MKHIFVIIILLIHFFGKAQTIKTLNVNDSIKATIDDVQNYPISKISVPVEHKKYTILHLISTTCAPCLAMIPTLDNFQKQFDKEIQIILVFHEDLQNINKYKKFVTELQQTILPIVTNESGLYKRFKISVFGDNVWIDDQGIIKMQNRSEDLNLATINDLLKNKKEIKSQIYNEMDLKNSVAENLKRFPENKLITSFQLFRIDKNFKTNLKTGFRFEEDDENNYSKLYSYDTDLKTFGKKIFDHHTLLHPSRIIYDIQSKEKLIPDFDSEHYNHFAFEFITNVQNRSTILRDLKNEVENSLNIRFIDTILNTDCYVIKRFKEIDLKTKHVINDTKVTGAKTKFNNEMLSISNEFKMSVKSYHWWSFVDYLNNVGNRIKKFDLYIEDESGIDPNQKIDISFYNTPDNIDAINNSLKKYGLELEKTKRVLPVIIIKERL